MADEFELEFITKTTVDSQPHFWYQYPVMKELMSQGKSPSVVHLDIKADTLGTSLAEIAATTTSTVWFDDPKAVTVVSTSTSDIGKGLSVFGQKSDGAIGEFTYETDGTDGTTTVALGNWKNIWTARITDTGTINGTVIIYHTTTNALFTLNNSVKDPKLGKLYIPDGYNGVGVTGLMSLSNIPTNAQHGDYFRVGESFESVLTTNNPIVQFQAPLYSHIASGQSQIKFQGKYQGSVTTGAIHSYTALWES